MKKVYWVNRKGEKIDIDTMDMQYLQNALKMAVNTITTYRDSIISKEKKEREFILHGEIAQNFYEAMVEAELEEMGFHSEEDYEYYLKTRGE